MSGRHGIALVAWRVAVVAEAAVVAAAMAAVGSAAVG
jgi:hypothetical protein